MKKALLQILAMGYILSTMLLAGGVNATVDTTEVVRGNPVILKIKATGGSVEFPTISTIDGVAVTGTSTSSSKNISIINGSIKSEVTTSKIIQFIPQKDMTIPSYVVKVDGKEYKTDPIDIKVVKSNAPATKGNALFTLKMKANRLKVKVGEPLIVTVYFALRKDAQVSQNVEYNKPDLSAFVKLKDAVQRAYIKGNYHIQELQYVVTAQKEGNFTIAPADVKVGVEDTTKRDFFGMGFATKWYETSSNKLHIEVLPQTKNADMVGEFKITSKIDKKEVKANKPVNLTVKIEGYGTLDGFEFPKYDIDGVTVYSDDAKVDTKIVNNRVYTTYTKSFAFISDRDFKIPKCTFSALYSKTDTLKTLSVPEYNIEVKKSKNIVAMATSNNGIVQTNQSKTTTPKEVVVKKIVRVKSVAWWMLTLAFLAGMLVMYMVRFIPKREPKAYKESEALKILYGHISEDEKIEEMVRKLYAKKAGDKSVKIDKKELKEMVEKFL